MDAEKRRPWTGTPFCASRHAADESLKDGTEL